MKAYSVSIAYYKDKADKINISVVSRIAVGESREDALKTVMDMPNKYSKTHNIAVTTCFELDLGLIDRRLKIAENEKV